MPLLISYKRNVIPPPPNKRAVSHQDGLCTQMQATFKAWGREVLLDLFPIPVSAAPAYAASRVSLFPSNLPGLDTQSYITVTSLTKAILSVCPSSDRD